MNFPSVYISREVGRRTVVKGHYWRTGGWRVGGFTRGASFSIATQQVSNLVLPPSSGSTFLPSHGVIRTHFSSLSRRHPGPLFFALMTSSGPTFFSLSWRHPGPLFLALMTSSWPTFFRSHDVIRDHFSSLSRRLPVLSFITRLSFRFIIWTLYSCHPDQLFYSNEAAIRPLFSIRPKDQYFCVYLVFFSFLNWSDSSPEVQDCTEQRVLRIYRGPDFLAVVWFISSPVPQARPAARERETPCWRGVWGKSQPYDIEKVWSSMNHSIRSGTEDLSVFLITVAQGVRQRIENGDLPWGRQARIRCRRYPDQGQYSQYWGTAYICSCVCSALLYKTSCLLRTWRNLEIRGGRSANQLC